MTQLQSEQSAASSGLSAGRIPVREFVRLARPKQWAKGAFVLVGPLYALADPAGRHDFSWIAVLYALVAFSLASSGCYVINDIRDREVDRHHPRKSRRPIASGAVSVRQGWAFALLLYGGAALAVGAIALIDPRASLLVGVVTLVYAANVTLYSYFFKRVVVLDVMSLALGFVLRVLAGCAAAVIEPSTWLLNCTLFLAMFLAFGKRLGERRTMGEDAGLARKVQGTYTDDMLRMMVAMTAVATLVAYAGYIQDRSEGFTWASIALWATLLPATFGLLRCIVLVESGEYDDPTEIAVRDRAFQAGAAAFGMLTLALLARGAGWFGTGG